MIVLPVSFWSLTFRNFMDSHRFVQFVNFRQYFLCLPLGSCTFFNIIYFIQTLVFFGIQRISCAIINILDHGDMWLLEHGLLFPLVVSFLSGLVAFLIGDVVVLMLLFVRSLEARETAADKVAHFGDWILLWFVVNLLLDDQLAPVELA